MTAIKNKIDAVVARKISDLKSNQKATGYFVAQTLNTAPGRLPVDNPSSFITSLILLSLRNLPDSVSWQKIIEKGIDFLVGQRSAHWSFNYWIRKSVLSKTMAYPDDLDCTFCALSAISLYRPTVLTGKVMAHATSLLTALEKQTGGPYRTWLVPESADQIWRDVDPAVNANIAYFLSLNRIDLPRLTAFLEKSISKGLLASPYYDGMLPVIYFISHFYKGKHTESIIVVLEKYYTSTQFERNPLRVALIISSLINIGAKTHVRTVDVDYLLETSSTRWSAYPFIIQAKGKAKDTIQFVGSADLTTAICLEALDLYVREVLPSKSADSTANSPAKSPAADRIYSRVLRNSKAVFRDVGTELGFEGNIMLKKIIESDPKRHITLLPYYFASMLRNGGKKIPEELLITLGGINLYGWTAYTIYDNFLDDEGAPVQLSVANILLREIVYLSGANIFGNSEFLIVLREVLNGIDSANTWETRYCRLNISGGTISMKSLILPKWGKYEQLAKRSFGHALGPMGILMHLGYSRTSPEMKNLRIFFTHYLIARQLNDDAHDWEDDLKKVQLNPVVCLLISEYHRSHPSNSDVALTSLILKCNEIFWYGILPDVCKIILSHINKAKSALHQIPVIENHAIFESILNDLELTTDRAVKEQKNTVEFLQEFSK